MKLNKKDRKVIDESFFDIDEENKIVKVVLQYDKFDDIVETSYVSSLPIFNADFMSGIGNAFELVSSKYKIDLTIRFDDMGGYTEEQIFELLKKNLLLEIQSNKSVNKKRKKLGYALLAIGVICLLAMLATDYFWTEESVLSDIVFYIFDIATTVSFWEAMTILVVEQTENKAVKKNFEKRLAAIHFEKSF